MASLWLMSEAGVFSAAPLSLDALRSEGAQRFDPVRFHYLEVLARRLQDAPVEVRRILEGKLNDALKDYAGRLKQRPHAADGDVHQQVSQAVVKAACLPLAQLNRHIEQASQHQAGFAGTGRRPGNELADRAEMKSLRGFRQAWARVAAQDQLDKAVGRGPQNAGPLNSHVLVLRSLALMRELSPDYLRRFMSHLDALLWLDQANQPLASSGARSAKRNKKDK